MSILRSLYFRISSASFLITFLSPEIATSIIIIIIFWGENLLAYADLQILFVLTLSEIKSRILTVVMFVILMLSYITRNSLKCSQTVPTQNNTFQFQ